MENKSAIVFVIDGINALMLPPYGNTAIEMPSLNELAASAVLFDFAYSESPELLDSLTGLWATESKNSLMSRLASEGVSCTLLTDDLELARSHVALDFDRVIDAQTETPDCLAGDPGESWLAQFFAQVIEAIQSQEPNSLLWVHCSGLFGAWDAPYPYRASLADEEDPDPPLDAAPPSGTYNPDEDSPDTLLGYQQSCFAQLMLLDQFLGVLIDQMPECWFALTSTRGYPLGEHGNVGSHNLHGESVHVPLLIRTPDRPDQVACRNPSLISLNELATWLCDWFEVPNQQSGVDLGKPLPDTSSEWVISKFQGMTSIQTHFWKLIRDANHLPPQRLLYKKPDDRWEVNNVFDRCPQVAPALEQLLDDAVLRAENGHTEPLQIPAILQNEN